MKHTKFRVFEGHGILVYQNLADEVNHFLTTNPHATPCSLGMEYVERIKTLFMSVGYEETGRDGNYKVIFKDLGETDFNTTTIATALQNAANTYKGIICHEFSISDTNNLIVALLLKD